MLLGAGRDVQTVGMKGRRQEPGKLLSRLGGEQEKNKEKRERKMGPQRRKSSTKQSRYEAEAGGAFPGRRLCVFCLL